MKKPLLGIVLGIALLLAACGPAPQPPTARELDKAIDQFEREKAPDPQRLTSSAIRG